MLSVRQFNAEPTVRESRTATEEVAIAAMDGIIGVTAVLVLDEGEGRALPPAFDPGGGGGERERERERETAGGPRVRAREEKREEKKKLRAKFISRNHRARHRAGVVGVAEGSAARLKRARGRRPDSGVGGAGEG